MLSHACKAKSPRSTGTKCCVHESASWAERNTNNTNNTSNIKHTRNCTTSKTDASKRAQTNRTRDSCSNNKNQRIETLRQNHPLHPMQAKKTDMSAKLVANTKASKPHDHAPSPTLVLGDVHEQSFLQPSPKSQNTQNPQSTQSTHTSQPHTSTLLTHNNPDCDTPPLTTKTLTFKYTSNLDHTGELDVDITCELGELQWLVLQRCDFANPETVLTVSTPQGILGKSPLEFDAVLGTCELGKTTTPKIPLVVSFVPSPNSGRGTRCLFRDWLIARNKLPPPITVIVVTNSARFPRFTMTVDPFQSARSVKLQLSKDTRLLCLHIFHRGERLRDTERMGVLNIRTGDVLLAQVRPRDVPTWQMWRGTGGGTVLCKCLGGVNKGAWAECDERGRVMGVWREVGLDSCCRIIASSTPPGRFVRFGESGLDEWQQQWVRTSSGGWQRAGLVQVGRNSGSPSSPSARPATQHNRSSGEGSSTRLSTDSAGARSSSDNESPRLRSSNSNSDRAVVPELMLPPPAAAATRTAQNDGDEPEDLYGS